MHEGHEHNKHHLTDEEKAAGKTPNSGKLHKDGTPVPGQTPEKDAERALERAAEQSEGEDTPADPGAPGVDPEPPKVDEPPADPPVV